jgi:hypothetical protein
VKSPSPSPSALSWSRNFSSIIGAPVGFTRARAEQLASAIGYAAQCGVRWILLRERVGERVNNLDKVIKTVIVHELISLILVAHRFAIPRQRAIGRFLQDRMRASRDFFHNA